MGTQKTSALEKARKKEADLFAKLDTLTDDWAQAEVKLRIAEIENSLQHVDRDEENTERMKSLEEELAAIRVELPTSPSEVLKGGQIVTDIPWQNGESVSWVYVWSLCTKWWVLFRVSHWEIGRVCGAIGTIITKCYGGMFQLMRYKNKLFWIRKKPMVYVRKGGPGGYIMAALGGNYIRQGTAGAVVASIHENFIRIGLGGYRLATIDGNSIRKGGPAGVIMATIDGSRIRRGGPAGVIIYSIDGDANNPEKGGLAVSGMVIDGEIG